MIGPLLIIIMVALLVVFHDVLLLAFGGVLVAIVLDTIVRIIRNRFSMPRWSALLLSILVPGMLIVLGLAYGGAILARQYAALQTAIPIALQAGYANLQAGPLAGLLPTRALDLQPLVGSAIGFAQRATGLISSGVGLVIGFGVMLFVGACLAAEPALYRDGIVLVLPPRHRSKALALFDETGRTLASWLSARLVSMFAIAVLSAVGLSVLRIPYAVALGILAGALAFIPNVGAFVAAVPAVILALAISPQRAALVLLMFWLAHTLDDFLVIPIAERRIVHLPPALTMLMQVALGGTVGLLGVAFAAPLSAVIILMTRVLWIEPLSVGWRSPDDESRHPELPHTPLPRV